MTIVELIKNWSDFGSGKKSTPAARKAVAECSAQLAQVESELSRIYNEMVTTIAPYRVHNNERISLSVEEVCRVYARDLAKILGGKQ